MIFMVEIDKCQQGLREKTAFMNRKTNKSCTVKMSNRRSLSLK